MKVYQRYSFLILFFLNFFFHQLAQSQTSDQIHQTINHIKKNPHINTFTISINGKTLGKYYQNNIFPQTQQDIRSVTKTILSLLTGIAIDKGYIFSVQDHLFSINPTQFLNRKDNFFHQLTIHHLLTMTAGFDWQEFGNINQYSQWWKSSNQEQYLLKRPIYRLPGSVFNYNSAEAHLLGIILAKKTGMSLKDFGNKYLFSPIGTKILNWEKDQQGYNNGASGLSMTSIDMQKIGNLILNKGKYKYRQVLPEKWVTEQSTPKVLLGSTINDADSYGYHTWLSNHFQKNYFYSMGYGGQLILIYPSKKMVVTATSEWQKIKISEADRNWNDLINTVTRYLLNE